MPYTVVFGGDVKDLDTNPLRVLDSPFGDPISVAIGDLIEQREYMRAALERVAGGHEVDFWELQLAARTALQQLEK